MHRARDQEKPGGFLPTVNRSPDASKKFSSVYELARPIHYKGDGSGRDPYCMVGNGGFMNPMRQVALDPRKAFQQSLRGYHQDGEYAERRQRRMLRKAHKRTLTQIIDAHQLKVDPQTRPERSSMAQLQVRSAAPRGVSTRVGDSQIIE